jgi:hypothetical protein
MKTKSILSRLLSFFTVAHMSKNTELHGELPSTGELYRKFLKVAWPSAIESFLICLVGVIDTIMVSKLGEEAIAAVGITNQPKFIVLAVIFSLNVGVTAVVARRKGEEDRISANRTLRVSILVSLVAVLLTGTVAYKACGIVSGGVEDRIAVAGVKLQLAGCLINKSGRSVVGSGDVRILDGKILNGTAALVNQTAGAIEAADGVACTIKGTGKLCLCGPGVSRSRSCPVPWTSLPWR